MLMNNASDLNYQGIGFLAANETGSAVACFKSALGVFKTMAAPEKSVSGAVPSPNQVPCPLAMINLSESEAAGQGSLCNVVFHFATDAEEEITVEKLTVCSGAVMYNCALAFEQTVPVSSPAKARHLYDKCAQLFDSVSEFFDCSGAVTCALRRIVEISYALRDLQTVQVILHSFIVMAMTEVVAQVTEEKGDLAAAMA
jgi:hypothetical protein